MPVYRRRKIDFQPRKKRRYLQKLNLKRPVKDSDGSWKMPS